MADVNSGRKCGECAFFRRKDTGQHECRRRAAWPMLVPREKSAIGVRGMEKTVEMTIQAFYPPMRETSDMCGEFEPAIAAPQGINLQ